MRLYELSYLISPDLSGEETKKLSQRVAGYVQQENGVLDFVEGPVKKRLGYPIEKKDTSLLATLRFNLDSVRLGILEKKLKLEPQILRYMILTGKAPKIAETTQKTPKGDKKEKPLLTDKPKEKVELKEIEKKLEEILSE